MCNIILEAYVLFKLSSGQTYEFSTYLSYECFKVYTDYVQSSMHTTNLETMGIIYYIDILA